MTKDAQGKPYFIDHNNKVTSYEDPRATMGKGKIIFLEFSLNFLRITQWLGNEI
jgi:hypothetical protein